MEIKRVAAVTGGLVVAGGIAGALAAALAVGLVVAVGDGLAILVGDPQPMAAAGIIGALYGSVLGPLAAWLLMRHVPLGLAIGGTMLGTLVGGVAALVMHGNVFTWPLVGFAAAALALRIAVPPRVRVAG